MSDNEDDINDEQGEEEQGGEEEGDIGAGEVEAGDEDTKVAEEGEGEGEEKEEKEDGEEKEGEEKEGGEEEEEEEKVPPKILTEEMLFECLSLLCKTGDGLAHAFIKLDVQERELTDISLLRSYIHLRFVDISTNHIKNLSPLSSLTHLLVLKADSNVLTSAQLDDLPYLQTANFSKNQIRNTIGIGHPMLENLNLNNNRIASITGLDAGKLHCLSVLELRANALESTRGLNIPTLKKLYLAANKITKLEDIGQLTQLVTLHMRENQLENLDGFTASMTNLEYINLRGNHVNDFAEIKKLQVLPNLKAIVLSENAIAERDDYRLETLITLRRLERLDKDQYNDDERHEAEDVYNQRVQEEMMNKQELADQQELLEEPPIEE